MAGFEENSFINEHTKEELNVCYEDSMVFFTFYNKRGKAYKKAIYNVETNEAMIEKILNDFMKEG